MQQFPAHSIDGGSSMVRTTRALLLLVATPLFLGLREQPDAAPTPGFTVEYSYKIRWGHQAEWMEMYKKNHYPILVRQRQMGRILSMSAVTPINHAGEADRWDLRFTITWKDAATAHDSFDSGVIARELYPNQAVFKAEEQRRFELLDAHTDVPVVTDDLSAWKATP
jgi:hypothetical protein